MKKVILFARVSSEQQSYERQKTLLMPLIKSDGYEEEDIAIIQYKESAIKNDIQNRKSIQELEDIISNNDIKNVYVTEISRLARRNDVMYEVLALLERKQIALVIQSPHLIRTYEDINGVWTKNHIADVIIAFMRHLAVSEMTVKKERMKSGREQKKKEGYITASRTKFGYDNIDKRPYINAEQAAVVKEIFESYAKGLSTGKIWNNIKHLGYFDTSNDMLRTGGHRIYYILVDKTYIGQGTIKYPRIIDDELFYKVQELLSQNKLVQTQTKYVYYCQGLLKYKGYTMVANASRAIYYHTGEDKHKVSFNMNCLDTVVKQIAINALSYLSADELSEKEEEYKKRQIKLNKEIEHLAKDIENKNEEQERVNSAYFKGKVNEDKYSFLCNKIEEEIAYLNKEIEDRNVALVEIENILNKHSSGELIDIIAKYNSLLNMTDDNEIFDLIHSVIKEIQVTQIDKTTYDFKIIYHSQAVPNDEIYRYKRSGPQIKIYQIYDGVYTDWTCDWGKRILRTTERNK